MKNSSQYLLNNNYSEVFLQILIVNKNGSIKSRLALVTIFTGSQRSYVTQTAASEMLYETVRCDEMTRAPFDGTNTKAIDHSC